MQAQLIDKELLRTLHEKARESERLRMNFDLRTTPEDTSQRMLNALEVGTEVPIHQHGDTSETVICIQGKLDVIFLEEVLNLDAAVSEREFQEFFRIELCPAKGKYGMQIPKGVWHTIEVKEESTIFEAKDGKYIP